MTVSNAPRILIIEDNVFFQRILEKKMTEAGFEVFIAGDGLTGLDMARRLRPDLIVLDLMLPNMDGHKVCRFIKFDKTLRHIPIVILTSRDTEKDAQLAKQVHADAFLVKTMVPSYILKVISELLERSKLFELQEVELNGQKVTYLKRKQPVEEEVLSLEEEEMP